MSYTFLVYCFVFVQSCFKKSRDKIRVQVNLVTILLVNIPYLIVQLSPDYSYDSSTNLSLMIVIAVPIFLSINLLLNASFFIYLLVKKICSCRKVETKEEDAK